MMTPLKVLKILAAAKEATEVVLEEFIAVAEVIGDNSEMNQDPRYFVQQISERAVTWEPIRLSSCEQVKKMAFWGKTYYYLFVDFCLFYDLFI